MSDALLEKYGIKPVGTPVTTAAPVSPTTSAIQSSDDDLLAKYGIKPVAQAAEEAKNDWSVMGEVGRAVATGAINMANSVMQLPADVGITEQPLGEIPDLGLKPKTMVGDMASGAVQFLIPFAGAYKGLTWAGKLMKVGQNYTKAQAAAAGLGKAAGAGFMADYVAFEAEDPNLSAFLQSMPEAQRIPVVNEITKFLATSENNPAAVQRFYNALEGLGLGAATEGILKGLKVGIKASGQGIEKAYLALPDPIQDKIKSIRDRIEWTNLKMSDQSVGFRRLRQEAEDKASDGSVDYLWADPNWSKKVLAPDEQYRLVQNDIGSIVEHVLTKGTYTLKNVGRGEELVRTGEGLRDIFETIKEAGPQAQTDFDNYIKYKRAESLENTPHGSPFPVPERQAALTNLSVKPYFSTLVAGGERLKQFNGRMFDMLEDMDVLPKKLYDPVTGAFNKSEQRLRYEHASELYVPFYRTMQMDDQFNKIRGLSTTGKKLYTTKNPITKRLNNYSKMTDAAKEELNRDNPIDSGYINLVRGYSAMVEHAFKNKVKLNAIELVESLELDGIKWATPAVKAASPTNITKERLKELVTTAARRERKAAERSYDFSKVREMNMLIDDMTDLDALDEDVFKFWSSKVDLSEDGVTVVYRNGKAEAWQIKDPFLAESIAVMGPRATHQFFRTWAKYGRIFRSALTRAVTMDPTFFLGTNLIRDTVSVSMLSRGKFVPFVDTFRGMAHTLSNDNVFKDYQLQGGSFGSHTFGSATSDADHYKMMLGKYGLTDVIPLNVGTYTQMKLAGSQFKQAADNFVSRFEYASRTREYEKLLKAGYSPRKAAYLAREVAVDFANRGSSEAARSIISTIPFMNAHLQAVTRTLRALGGKKLLGRTLNKAESEEMKRVWTKVSALAFVAGAVIPAAHHLAPEIYGEEEGRAMKEIYNAIDKHVRDTNFVIVFGASGKVMTMPKPYDFAILATTIERMMDNEFNPREKNILSEYIMATVGQMTRASDFGLVPQALRAPFEIGFNDKFGGSPVVPESMKNMAPEGQYGPQTQALAIVIGQKLGVSPLKVEHVINSFTARFGGYVDEYLGGYLREDMGMPEKATLRDDQSTRIGGVQIPLLSEGVARMWEQAPLRHTRYETEFYERLKESMGVANYANSLQMGLNEFSRKKLEEMGNDPDTKFWIDQYPILRGYLEGISAINGYLKIVADDENMDGAQKLEQLMQYQAEKQNLMKEVNDTFMMNWNEKEETK